MTSAFTGFDVLGAGPTVTVVGGDSWWQNAMGVVHTAGTLVLSVFGAKDLAAQLQKVEADAGLLPEWARPEGYTPPADSPPDPEPAATPIARPDPVATVDPQYAAAYQEWLRKRRESPAKSQKPKTALQVRLEAARLKAQQDRTVLGAMPDRIITIRVKNPLELAAQQGGIAKLAAGVIPETVAARVYAEMAKQFANDLKLNKVDAEVAVVDASSVRGGPVAAPHDAQAFLRGAAVGAGAAGVAGLLWKLLTR